MELKFETRMWETANCNVVTVPKAFIKHGLLNPNQRYEVIIRQLPDASKKPQEALSAFQTRDILSAEIVPFAQQAPRGTPAQA